MDRRAQIRPEGAARLRACGRRDRIRIARDDGRSQFLEAMVMLGVLAALIVVLGLAVGVPLAVMLNDICTSIKC